MAAVAIAKPKKKQRADRVEPYDDTASEASIPSLSQKTSRPNSAWSSKGEDVNDNFYANGESVASESQVINKGANETTVADPEQSSISGSRGMLQKLRKNVVTPVDVEPKGSEPEVTRVNVVGKRSVPEAWDNHGHEGDMDSSQKSNRPVSASLYRPPSSMPLRPKSAPQGKLAGEVGKNGPYTETDMESIAEAPAVRPSTSKSISKGDSGHASIEKHESIGSLSESRSVTRAGTREENLFSKTPSSDSMLAPPVASGEPQAYVPYDYAKDCIAKVVDNMKRMKGNHLKVIEKIQDQYKAIEEHTQGQFNDYVIKLRMEYSDKVGTFRKIIEIHQTEQDRNTDYWKNCIKSLKEKNKLLLEDRRKYLTKTKDEFDKLEEDKVKSVKHLTALLDEKHADYLKVLEKLKGEEFKRQEVEQELKRETEKEKELQQQNSDERSKMEEEKKEIESNKMKTEVALKESEEANAQLNQTVSELEAKLKDMESKQVSSVGVVVSESFVQKDKTDVGAEAEKVEFQKLELQKEPAETATSVTGLAVAGISSEESKRLEKRIEELESLLVEKEKASSKLEKENDGLNDAIQKLKSESGNRDIVVLELKRENENLKERLKVAVSQMADVVDTSDVQSKMEALSTEKNALEEENHGYKEELEKWRLEFQEENDGREPTEEDRTERIEGLIEEIKSNDKKLQVMSADIAVMKLLLGAPVEETEEKTDTSDDSDELVRKLIEEKNSLLEDLDELKRDQQEMKDELEEAKEKNTSYVDEIETLKREKEELEEKIEELSAIRTEGSTSTVTEDILVDRDSAADEALRAELEELTKSMENQQTEYNSKIDELNVKLDENQMNIENLTKEKDDYALRVEELEGKIANDKTNFENQLEHKQKEIDSLKDKQEELEAARLSNLPVDAAEELKAMRDRLKALEDEKEALDKEVIDSKDTVASLNLNIEKLNKMIEKEKERSEEIQAERKKVKDECDKKVKDLEQKLATAATAAAAASAATRKQSKPTKEDTANVRNLQKKIDTLQKQLAEAKEKALQAPVPKEVVKEPKGPSLAEEKLKKENDKLNEKIEAFKKASKEDKEKIKALQVEVREAKEKAAKAGPSAEDKIAAKKQEKKMTELQKTLETEKKRTEKLKGDLTKTEEDLAGLKKELSEANAEVKRKEDEMAKLGVAAKQGADAMAKVEELEVNCKKLTEENKVLSENYNSERILRKKYYNMVEDMKGKIRVYARCRPLSTSEKDRGNFSVLKSPDEYTLIVDTQRGPKEFQYDAVFMPESTQEKVFEDTSMLIQSAVDGYNVCIFAYGQTGSGKTFTVIGDKEQKFPGIAPRAFQQLFELLGENKNKFDFRVELYMLELYMDKLIDLFATNKDAKLDIKKDKKGMVIVQGAVVHQAGNAVELMSLFEKGSSTRHISSTKMNAESSRSHLVVSIIVEAINRTSGAVTKGKLSLVDLAGSERAAKTGATPEQLKEAQSINKSLSALGDVISALSSEQSFIPYRNNKLTLLMQDSLGGNAKTLMFVNVSPADYNCDETITSLTYASRVKLITNDASKNAESKEVAKLKAMIAKLKKGEAVEEEDDAQD